MRDCRATNPAKELCCAIRGDLAPADPALHCIRHSHCWIEVRTRDIAKRQDERDENDSGGNGICEEGQGDVTSREPLGHNPGAHNTSNKESRTKELRSQSRA